LKFCRKACAGSRWISAQILMRVYLLFDAFYTTKPQGMGMGLAVSCSIIEAHRGRLWAMANAPRGAVFQFTLPIRIAAIESVDLV
jgi:signal transduction histidine kinase